MVLCELRNIDVVAFKPALAFIFHRLSYISSVHMHRLHWPGICGWAQGVSGFCGIGTQPLVNPDYVKCLSNSLWLPFPPRIPHQVPVSSASPIACPQTVLKPQPVSAAGYSYS